MSDESIREALRQYVQRQTGASHVRVASFSRLSGGAIQNNLALALECTGGAYPGMLDLVVRSDAVSQVDVSLSREHEFRVLQCAWQAGVTVPEPLWLCTDLSVIGAPFCVMRRVAGFASGRQLVRGMLAEDQARALTQQLAQELARLHAVRPPDQRLDFLPVPSTAPALRRVHNYRIALDGIPEAHPVIEWALNWLEDNAPPQGELVLCHGDFRTGNYMVDAGRLSGVLDWEFASWSDPLEDIGWLCAKSWRFGQNDREVGGIGHKRDLFSAYAHASGREVDARQVLYWEAMGLTRWAIIALQQAQRHISGEEPSLELALTGRMVPEMEYDLLCHIGRIEGVHEDQLQAAPGAGGGEVNRPAGDELLGIARRVLLDALLPLLPEAKTYDVLMIANAMAIAARELAAGQAAGKQPDDGVADFLRTAGLQGAGGEAGLAILIRERAIHTSDNASLHTLLFALTQSKLALSNPKYVRHGATEHGQ